MNLSRRPGHHLSGGRRLTAAAALVLFLLLVGLAGLIRQGQQDQLDALDDRFATRASLTASFTRDVIADLAARETGQAERLLAGPAVDKTDFDGLVAAFDFEAAVLLDDHGRLLQVWPSRPEMLGKDMTVEYAHLRAAVAGEVGISGVVPSAVRRVPITAVAIPFDTIAGRRILSGAFTPQETPLGAYLGSVLPFQGGNAFLIDASGEVLASGDGGATMPAGLSGLREGVTQLSVGGEAVTVAVTAIDGVPWRVVLTAPSRSLHAPAERGRVAGWLLLGAFAAAGIAALFLLLRLSRARSDAHATARIDRLTGLPNRRAMEEALTGAVARATRHGEPLALLMIDLDHFKSINDRHGHDVGDAALRVAAEQLDQTARAGDMAGRWGGEEFLVVLSHTDLDAGMVVAERMRQSIAAAQLREHAVTLSASIGLAVLHAGGADALLREADAALYAAKDAGRNRTIAAPPPVQIALARPFSVNAGVAAGRADDSPASPGPGRGRGSNGRTSARATWQTRTPGASTIPNRASSRQIALPSGAVVAQAAPTAGSASAVHAGYHSGRLVCTEIRRQPQI